MLGSPRISAVGVGMLVLAFGIAVRAESQRTSAKSVKEDVQLKRFYRPNLCGPISLFAICRYYGIDTTIDEVADLTAFDGRPVSIEALVRAARAKGLEATPLNASVGYLEKIGGPAILDFPTGHACVFLGWKEDQAQIQDPPHPVRGVSIEELKEKWGRHLITFSLPKETEKKMGKNQKPK